MSARGAVIAIDLGTKHTGLAVTDALRIAREPLRSFHGGETGLCAHLQELARERDVEAFVLGLPLDMDGGEGPRARAVRLFGQTLAQRFPAVAIAFQDERLSSKAAEELARELGLRGARARELHDSLSAVVILRDWLAAGEPR